MAVRLGEEEHHFFFPNRGEAAVWEKSGATTIRVERTRQTLPTKVQSADWPPGAKRQEANRGLERVGSGWSVRETRILPDFNEFSTFQT